MGGGYQSMMLICSICNAYSRKDYEALRELLRYIANIQSIEQSYNHVRVILEHEQMDLLYSIVYLYTM